MCPCACHDRNAPTPVHLGQNCPCETPRPIRLSDREWIERAYELFHGSPSSGVEK